MLVLTQTGSPRAIPRPIRPLELRQYRYFVVLTEELPAGFAPAGRPCLCPAYSKCHCA